MRFGRTPPGPPPADQSLKSSAHEALESSAQSYQDAIARATAAVEQGDRMRRIRIRNNIGPSFGVVYERRH